MRVPVNYQARFAEIWPRALLEVPPDPNGAVGELVRLLEEFLDVEQIQHAAIGNSLSFLFNLSSLGLSGLGWNVLLVSPPPSDESDEVWQAEFLAEQKHVTDSIGYCFHLYLANVPPPKNRFVGVSQEAVFLGRDDLEEIFSAQVPKMALAAIVRRQTPLARRCPFDTNHEASGAMFYGRRSELSMIVEELGKSVAVMGARRIGKTSLLRQGYTILRNRLGLEGRRRVHYFNCLTWANYTHACHMLAHKIDPRRELRLSRADHNVEYMFERCSQDGSRPLYLFLDEVDRLIDLDAIDNWRFFNLLAWAKDAGMVRFVLAGYRSIGRLVFGQQKGTATAATPGPIAVPVSETPFLLALEPLSLSPLARKEADALFAEPLASSEVQIENKPKVMERVWKATIGYPFLIQFFGLHMFQRAVERDPQQITVDDVSAVEESPALREFLETHFIENTLRNGVPVLAERSCAFFLAHADAPDWAEQDFWEACRPHEVPLGTDGLGTIHRAVKNLSDAQILTFAHGRYSIAFPVMKNVLVSSYTKAANASRRPRWPSGPSGRSPPDCGHRAPRPTAWTPGNRPTL